MIPARRIKFLLIPILLLLAGKIKSQDKDLPVLPTIMKIPHKTLYEKIMWIHRTATFIITKERKITYDTTYIKAYPKRFTVTMPVSGRLMYFDLIDWKNNERLNYIPNYRYDLGIGLSSRWATFIANTGVRFYNNNKEEKGSTRYTDLQLNLFGKWVTSDISYQNYHGFYIANTRKFDYPGDRKFEVRSDVRAILFANSAYYVFNAKKFSYRSSFAFTERQLKSAGSFLLGTYYTIFSLKADSSLVSTAFAPYFNDNAHIVRGSAQSFGINAGYIYTGVHNKFYLTTSVVPGIGLNQEYYMRDDTSTYLSKLNPSWKLNLRLGIGYDQGNYFFGTSGVYDYFWLFNKTNATFNYSTSKFMVFVGYRFKAQKVEQKILRKLKFIDYPGDPRNE